MNEREIMDEAKKARNFSGIDTLIMGIRLTALSLKFRRISREGS